MYKQVLVTNKRKVSGHHRLVWTADAYRQGEGLEFDVVDATRNDKIIGSGSISAEDVANAFENGFNRHRIGFLFQRGVLIGGGWEFKEDIKPHR